jgi:uncharacterized repeat protein (TIGR01451 family)
MAQRMQRRGFLGLAISGLAAFVSACAPAKGEMRVVESAEGPVLHWEQGDLIVLVSGAEPRYTIGKTVRLTIVLNNQGPHPIQARVRTKLIGRGMQAVLEAPVETLTIPSQGARSLERELTLTPDLRPGLYQLEVELPPWDIQGQRTGGGQISYPVEVEAAG